MPKNTPNPRFIELAKRMASKEPPKAREEKPKPSLEEIVSFRGHELVREEYEVLDSIAGKYFNQKAEKYFSNLTDSGKDVYLEIKDKHVQRLDMGRQGLKEFPKSIGNLSSLQWLFLSRNQLTSIPESIGNLSSLQRLYLNDNQLTSIPKSISNLSSLQGLYLYNNQLASIPESIGNLSSLQWLHLYGNQLDKRSKKLAEEIKRRGVYVEI